MEVKKSDILTHIDSHCVIKNCKVGAEDVLTMMQDGLPQTMNTLTERFKYWEINAYPGST